MIKKACILMSILGSAACGSGPSSTPATASPPSTVIEHKYLLERVDDAAALCELIGLGAAAFPVAWLSLFDTAPAMLDAGARYLRVVGPAYGLFGLGMALYFASQGAGRLLWPFLANMARLIIAAGGGWFALRWAGNLTDVFIALATAQIALLSC